SDVLAEPRAAALLELRRQRDRRVRAPLHRVRVLADRSARGLRESSRAAARQPLSPRPGPGRARAVRWSRPVDNPGVLAGRPAEIAPLCERDPALTLRTCGVMPAEGATTPMPE